VFDQERFDALARGLATNQLSRAQVLKSLAAGLLLSSIGALSPRHTRVAAAQSTVPKWCESVPNPAPPTPLKPTFPPRKDNVVKGDCKAFRRRAKTGVKLPGRKRPLTNEAGHTECAITFKKLPLYETREITRPGGPLVCLETTYVYPVTFTGRSTIYKLDWQPSSSACKDYESKIEKRIKDHEKVHANDCHAVAKMGSTVWNSQRRNSLVGFKACGEDPGGAEKAHNNIKAEITASLNDFLNTEITPCAVERGHKFHKAERYLPICCEGPGGCGCPSGKECCKTASGTDQTCVDLQTDPNNCGQCGKVCRAPRTSCVAGKCVCPPGRARSAASDTLCCPEGQTECAGACVDLSTDPNNCGQCGVQCPQGDTCVNGSCQGGGQCQFDNDCNTHETCCPPGSGGRFSPQTSYCADLQSDHLNCGQCGVECLGGDLRYCIEGQCHCPGDEPVECPPDPSGQVWCCPPGKVCCVAAPGDQPGGPPNTGQDCCDPNELCCHGSTGDPWCCPSAGYPYCCEGKCGCP
jgi:hypothetical protein